MRPMCPAPAHILQPIPDAKTQSPASLAAAPLPPEATLQPRRPGGKGRSGGGTVSFDHLVGAQQDRLWYGKTERLGGLEVYDHLEFCRKLHRQIARLRAAQDAIDISGGAT